MGQLQMGELILIGPKITIDQKRNCAQVDGTGVMHMPSNTNLDGGKSTKPGSVVTIRRFLQI